jgi:hypothetical protein
MTTISGAAHGADGLLHDAAGGVCARRRLVLRFGKPEEDDGGHAHVEGGGGLARDLVNREVEDARHRRDLAPHALARTREQRQDQILAGEARLAHERPHALAPPQTPRSVNQIAHLRKLTFKTLMPTARMISAPARRAQTLLLDL